MTTATVTPPRLPDRPAGWWCYPFTWAFVSWITPMITGQLSGWWLPVIALAVTALGVALVRIMWPRVLYGSLTAQAVLFVVVVGVAFGAWLVMVRTIGDPLPVWQHWLIGCAVLGGWWVVLALWAPLAAAAVDARRRNLPDGAPPEKDPFGEPYYTILQKAGLIPELRIVDVVSSPSGGVQSVHVRPVDLPGKQILTFDWLRNKVPALSTHADRLIDGIDIDDDDITPEKITSSRWIIHFTVKRVLKEPRPYPIRTTPRPVGDPLNLGNYETDKPLELSTFTVDHGASHLDLVAGTGGSKTTCCHCLVAEDNASDSWEVWLFASQKLTHLAWPWIRPWLEGKTDRPPVDAVFGQSQERILQGLMWACQLAVAWNSATDSVREVTPGKGGLTLVIDESSDCLRRDRDKVRFRMGANWVEMNASEMVAKLAEIARTAPIKVVRASQYGLFDSAGSAGAESRRNFLAAIIGKVSRPSDANNVAPGMPPGWDATKLRDYMIYVQPNLEEPTVLRAKAWALYKELVDPVAIAYAPWRNGLDRAATRKLTGYGERWDPRFHPELVAFANAKGLKWPLASGQILAPQATLADDPTTDTTTTAPPVPVPAAPAGPPNPEVPVPDDQPLPADWQLPDGWSTEDFDVLAALGIGPAAGADTDPTAPPPGGVLANPDISGIRKANQKLRADADWFVKVTKLPEPLGRILVQLRNPRAQRVVSTGWVPTEILAEVLGRFEPDADEKARQQAVSRLGWDINQVTGLKSAEIPRPVLAQLGMERKFGWRVDELQAAGDRLMANIPDEPSERADGAA